MTGCHSAWQLDLNNYKPVIFGLTFSGCSGDKWPLITLCHPPHSTSRPLTLTPSSALPRAWERNSGKIFPCEMPRSSRGVWRQCIVSTAKKEPLVMRPIPVGLKKTGTFSHRLPSSLDSTKWSQTNQKSDEEIWRKKSCGSGTPASLSLCRLCRWKMHTDCDLFAPRCPLYRRNILTTIGCRQGELLLSLLPAQLLWILNVCSSLRCWEAYSDFWHWNLSDWHLFWGISVCTAQATERAGLRKHLPVWRAAHLSDPTHIRWFPCLRYLAAAPFGPATIGCPGPLLFPTHSLIIRGLTMS